jgi:hypothetical protein
MDNNIDTSVFECNNETDIVDTDISKGIASIDKSKRGRGRTRSSVWELLTDDIEAHKSIDSTCKHCHQTVHHYKKSDSAKIHLNKCHEFKEFIKCTDEIDCPEWYQRKKENQRGRECFIKSQGSNDSQEFCGLSRKEKDKFQELMAMHYYSTGTPFQRIDDPHLRAAIKILCPEEGVLPTRRQLASTLLTKCYKEVESKVEEQMSGGRFCLISDAWSNVKNDSIINYMAVSPENCFFLESVSTEDQSHNHEYISQDISRVIHHYKHATFAGVVTDNSSANKKAWTLLQKELPTCYFHGCCSHGLHLFVKDIFAATKTKKNGEDMATYPNGYPFEGLLEFIAKCKVVVKFFRDHHVPKVALQNLQKTTLGHHRRDGGAFNKCVKRS